MDEQKIDKLGNLPPKVGSLEEHPNFAMFTSEELKIFSDHCREKNLAKDEYLFNEGDSGISMFIVKKGAVNILKVGYLGETVIAQVNPGEFVGEMAVVDGSPRSAAVKAASDTELLELPTEKFNLLKKDHPHIAIKIMDLLLRLISTRLRSTTLKLMKK